MDVPPLPPGLTDPIHAAFPTLQAQLVGTFLAAIDLAEDAMADQDLVLDQPNPHVVLPEFGDSSVVMRLCFHIDNPSARKVWKARTDVIAAVKSAFAEGGVRIPFPQRELSTRSSNPGFDVPPASERDGASTGYGAAGTNGSSGDVDASTGEDAAAGADDAE